MKLRITIYTSGNQSLTTTTESFESVEEACRHYQYNICDGHREVISGDPVMIVNMRCVTAVTVEKAEE